MSSDATTACLSAQLVELAPACILAVSGDSHTITLANRAARALLESPEAVGCSLIELLPEGARTLLPALDAVRAGGPAFEERSLAVDWPERSGGTAQRYLDLRCERSPDGQHLMLFLCDVTDAMRVRRGADEELRDSEARYRLLADMIPDIVWIADQGGQPHYLNPRWTRYTGMPMTTSLEGAWRHAVHGEDLLGVMRCWRASTETEAPYEAEVRIRDAAGTFRWFMVRARPLRERPDAPAVWYGTATDIHARRCAEEALRQSEERYRTIVHTANEGIWLVDLEGRTVFANHRMAEILGSTPQGLLGSGLISYCFPEDVPVVSERLSRNFSGLYEQFDLRFRRDDGSVLHVLACTSPMEDGTGHIIGAVGMFTDVTERKRIDGLLREEAQRKDDFLAMLAHELRNPLAPICNAVQRLRQECDAATVSWARALIDRQVTHLARMVDDLLDVSRITRGKLHLRKENVDLRQLVIDIAGDHRPLLDEQHLHLSVEVPDDPVWMAGDTTRLSQMLGNLLQNAAKFTEDGGDVAVELQRAGDHAELTVRDSGVGIEQGLLDRVFEPFMQAEHSLERTTGGLGLGLALVRGLAQLHGGDALVRSEGPGKGTAVTLRLPLLPAPPIPIDIPAAPISPVKSPLRRRVLLVEDNPDIAESLQEVLEVSGHEVQVAMTGRQGERLAVESGPDFVLCDIGLPGGMDGYDVARALRPRLPTTYLIALTGYGRERDQQLASDAGFDLHLTKPVNLDHLEHLLQTLPLPRPKGGSRLKSESRPKSESRLK